MAFTGKYELVRNEGIEEHMKANGNVQLIFLNFKY